MSTLRKQFEQARAEYRELRYPGDLAADVLAPATAASSPPGGLGQRLWTVATVTAAAAALVLVTYFINPAAAPVQVAKTTTTNAINQTDVAEETVAVSWSDVPALSFAELPADLSLSPPWQGLSLAPPAIWFLIDTTESEHQETSTTQEAV